MGNYVLFRNIPKGSVLEVWAELSAGAKLGFTGEVEDNDGNVDANWLKSDLVPGKARHALTESIGVVLTALFQNTKLDTVQVYARIVDAQGTVLRPTRADIVMSGKQGAKARGYIDVVCLQ